MIRIITKVFFCIVITYSLGSLANPFLAWTENTQLIYHHKEMSGHKDLNLLSGSKLLISIIKFKDVNLNSIYDCVYIIKDNEKYSLGIERQDTQSQCFAVKSSNYIAKYENFIKITYNVALSSLEIFFQKENHKFLKTKFLFKNINKVEPKRLSDLSSVEDNNSIFLQSNQFIKMNNYALNPGVPCYSSEMKTEFSDFNCSRCKGSYYSIDLNQNEKIFYCGPNQCGAKDRPACSLGFKESVESCDDSDQFYLCEKGLTKICQGRVPFCI